MSVDFPRVCECSLDAIPFYLGISLHVMGGGYVRLGWLSVYGVILLYPQVECTPQIKDTPLHPSSMLSLLFSYLPLNFMLMNGHDMVMCREV